MAQHEDLNILGPIAATAEYQQVDHETDETVETGHGAILAAQITPRTPRRNPRSTEPDEVSGTHRIAGVLATFLGGDDERIARLLSLR